MERLRISGIIKESIVDGPGLRLVIFTQGCKHNCEGCHNSDTHSFAGGKLIDSVDILTLLKENPLLDGVTFSGGDPFEQAKVLAVLGRDIRNMGFDIITYTGYLYEDIINSNNKDWLELLKVTDILIDGKFDITKKSLDIKFRGSTNQRVIDIKSGKTIEW